MDKSQKFETEIGGKKLIVEVGKFAPQTNGSCTVQYGDTLVLATAVMSDSVREDLDYFPLMVDYEERLYAAGKIKGSRFIKREGRPTDEAVLTGRLVDRSIRPLFNEQMRNDIQIVATVLAFDQENDPDIVALIAASIALTISDIPWNGPIAGIRIGQVDGEFVVNPSYADKEKSALDLIVAGTPEKVIMLEAGANQVPEQTVIDAIAFAQKQFTGIIKFIKEIQSKVGQAKSEIFLVPEDPIIVKERETIKQKIKDFIRANIDSCLFNGEKLTKASRHNAIEELRKKTDEHLITEGVDQEKRTKILDFFDEYIEEEISVAILKDEKRVDCRSLTEIRALSAEVGLLPRVHGSGFFKRGETHVLSAVTLGAPSDEQTLDGMEVAGKKHYIHHYNFPAYSVGETGSNRGPGRREIGHGALAERAIMPVLPSREDFPYTIRVVSEVLSSNGSSSMGATCGSTLALMDAGVPIKEPVAGIAMGLASDEKGNFKVFTDLQDLEDSKGGMDFKIAGTKNGITAIQMDTKTIGLTPAMVEKTIWQSREARLKILEVITTAIPAPRADLSPYAPRIISFKINPERIRDVIGPGGKIINEIIDKTGVTIDIEDDGLVMVCSANGESMARAIEWIKNLTREVMAGETFQGKVTRLMDFGAFVEVLPNQEGLVHISEMAPYRVNKVSDVVKVGQIVPVKVIKIDDQGRINLSMKRMAELDDKIKPE
jgi:polyribonucleotide nucleotidyltransferase